MTVAATLVVHFGDEVESGAFAAAVLDWELNVDAQGEAVTSFAPGDRVHFLVQHDATLRIGRIATTAGQVVAEGSGYRSVEQMLSFAAVAEAVDLTYIPAGAVSRDWQQGVNGLNAREGTGFAVSGRQVTVTGNLPCLCVASYRARFNLYSLVCPSPELAENETVQIEIHIYLEAA